MAAISGQEFNPLRHAIILAERDCASPTTSTRAQMLERTRARTSISVPEHRTLTVLTKMAGDEPIAPNGCAIGAEASRNILLQPANRGTAAAILFALMRIANQTPNNAVAIFPADHNLTDDRVFMRHVNFAFSAVEARPELTVILGMAALGPECSYGWIEPGDQLSSSDPVRAVRRFVGQPEYSLAIDLMRRGALWNSFVTVARVSTLLSLIMIAEPELYSAFVSIRSAIGTRTERSVIERLYSGIPEVGFSGVLAGGPVNLAVLPVSGVAFRNVVDSPALPVTPSRHASASAAV